MRGWVLAVALLTVSGGAAAGDIYDDARYYDSSDYAAQAYYRLDFGTSSQFQTRHVVGFRMDNERGMRLGLPSVVKTEFGSDGSQRLALNGMDLSGMLVANGVTGSWWGDLTTGEIITVTAAVLAVGFGTAAALDDDSSGGTGGTGGTGTGGS